MPSGQASILRYVEDPLWRGQSQVTIFAKPLGLEKGAWEALQGQKLKSQGRKKEGRKRTWSSHSSSQRNA